MNYNKFSGNNINFLYGVMEVVHIAINFQLRDIGVNKITLTKHYFIVEFEEGYSIFISNYLNYDDICYEIELNIWIPP